MRRTKGIRRKELTLEASSSGPANNSRLAACFMHCLTTYVSAASLVFAIIVHFARRCHQRELDATDHPPQIKLMFV